MSPKSQKETEPEGMSLLEHLDELRSRLFKCAIALVVALIFTVGFGTEIFDVLIRPVQDQLPEGERLAVIRIAEGFLVKLKASALVAIFVAAPYLLYQLWAFVSPGLYRHERRWVVPFLVGGTVFFVLGGAFGHQVVVPAAAHWLANQAAEFENNVTAQEAFAFVSRLVLGLGLVFEMPIVIFFLARFGIVTPRGMMRHFRIVVLVVAVLSALLTPPDPMSMALFAAPMLVLYLVGVGVAWVFAKPAGGNAE